MVLPVVKTKKYKIKVDCCVNDLPFFTTFTYLFNGKKYKNICYHAKQLRDRNFLGFQRISVQT